MNNRLKLQSKLEDMLGSRNVYYQPPENVNMKYPAIVYNKTRMTKKSADNSGYSLFNQYLITVIDKKPDNNVIEKLLELPYCSFDRSYKSDGLYHDVLSIYF